MSNHLEHISAIHKPIWSDPVHDTIDGTIAAAIAVTIADETSGCCDGLYNDNERLFSTSSNMLKSLTIVGRLASVAAAE